MLEAERGHATMSGKLEEGVGSEQFVGMAPGLRSSPDATSRHRHIQRIVVDPESKTGDIMIEHPSF